ncbi:MAG: hypothetical protein FWE53_04260 [Firmicutes bacterium]|nr:hypothetical protein [Bacillota bacterium]
MKYRHLIDAGVIIPHPEVVFIDDSVKIGNGTVIEPFNIIKGSTVIGQDVHLLAGNNIADSEIGSGCRIGPYAHLRPGSIISDNCRIGNFVEIKKSVIGAGSKIAHLTYVGDSEIGENVNLGCGTVTVNYDGKQKHKTVIGNGAFVGSNVNLVAPITIGKSAVVAAGSTVTEDVPDYALAIARERQTNKEDRYRQH